MKAIARILLTPLAILVTLLWQPGPASADESPGVDLQVAKVWFDWAELPKDDRCRGNLCTHDSDERLIPAIHYLVYNDGDTESWPFEVHLRVDGHELPDYHLYGDGLGSDRWFINSFALEDIYPGAHAFEVIIRGLREPGEFARIPVDRDPSNDRRTERLVIPATL